MVAHLHVKERQGEASYEVTATESLRTATFVRIVKHATIYQATLVMARYYRELLRRSVTRTRFDYLIIHASPQGLSLGVLAYLFHELGILLLPGSYCFWFWHILVVKRRGETGDAVGGRAYFGSHAETVVASAIVAELGMVGVEPELMHERRM